MSLDLTPEKQALVNSYTREAGVPAAPFMELGLERISRLQAQGDLTDEPLSILTFGGGGISHTEPAWYPWVPRAGLLQGSSVVNIDPATQSKLDLSQPGYHAITGSEADIVSMFKSTFHNTINKLQSLLPDSIDGYSLIIADKLLGNPELIAPELFARMISEGSHARSMEISRDIHLAALRAHLKLAAAELLIQGGVFSMDDEIYRAHDNHLYKVEGF